MQKLLKIVFFGQDREPKTAIRQNHKNNVDPLIQSLKDYG